MTELQRWFQTHQRDKRSLWVGARFTTGLRVLDVRSNSGSPRLTGYDVLGYRAYRSAVHYILSVLAVVALLLPGVAVALSPTTPLTNFPTEAQAQQHCSADTIVWLNLPTGIYHAKGQRWYGRTKSGAYVCRTEADHAGMRGSLNGQ
jgi:hypothetical protein